MKKTLALTSLEELRLHVHETLCRHDNLELEQTPLFETPIVRGKRVCGLFFQVRGPRLLRTYALWAGEENRILFYDNSGGRFAESVLSESPDPQRLVA